MNRFATKQCTVGRVLSFTGIGVHNGKPSSLTIEPAAVDSGYAIRRKLDDESYSATMPLHHNRVSRTYLCTAVDLGDAGTVSMIEHMVSALSGMGIDNALITVEGNECPVLDGSAGKYVEAIVASGIETQPAEKMFIKIKRSVTVRSNDAFAALEPYNGRAFDVEIDFESDVIGRQRMIFDWSPKRYVDDVSQARTFGFIKDAKVLRQAGYALGSSLENSIAVDEGKILNQDGLRYEDEFVRHKLLDAVGDLALAGMPIYGKFRSYKGGHGLNALVLNSLFASEQNYEIVPASALPLEFDALEELPAGLELRGYIRSVG
ncbi:UDP-3-O-acyl-N-acetylglucosamine deacetylase [Maritalea myrionectae]|uniref:UDP-3-O-acyl-N-acetylglucosamine deacetylase n=1 Tax=Maritalea myrionectae TaxID=454601 RepID=A0A2R4MD78_9HYPH|nr:UDP-3-O-acyl-N-acetylglucosamine deacetylase [Maritalea myrionectae]AVX03960.1 UDP-3-O-acyl-N-acetylglucosamine deacetylase [Maritalea myrionectae]